MSETTPTTDSTPINAAVPEMAAQIAATAAESDTAPAKVAEVAREQGRVASRNEREALKAKLLADNAKARRTSSGPTDEEPKSAAPKTDTKPAAKTDAPKTEEPKTDEPKTDTKPDRSVQQIAKLSTEIRDLKAKLAGFEGKPGIETKADYLAKVKADPSILLADVDDPALLTKLAEYRYRELSPEEKLRAEVDAKVSAVEKKLADAEAAKADLEHKSLDGRIYASTAQILKEGFDKDGIKIDHTKWPLCQRLAGAGEYDPPRLAMNIVTGLTKDLGRVPDHQETATFLEIAFDIVEADFKKKAAAFSLDAPASAEAPKTTTDTKAKDQKATTINSRMASGGRVPESIAPSLKTRAEREAYKAKVMAQHIRQRESERYV